MIFRAPRNQPYINRGGAAFGGVEYPDWALPSIQDFLDRFKTQHPWPEVTGNTAGFYLPVDEGFLRLPELIVGRFPNFMAAGVPVAGQRQPSIRRFLFPALPPGG